MDHGTKLCQDTSPDEAKYIIRPSQLDFFTLWYIRSSLTLLAQGTSLAQTIQRHQPNVGGLF